MEKNFGLALRCERAEMEAARASLRSWSRSSGSGAEFPAAGGVALYYGNELPLSQVLGAGLHGPVTPAEWDQVEQFYRTRHSEISVSLCPFADQSLLDLLRERGYGLMQMEHTQVRPLDPHGLFPSAAPGVRVYPASPEDFDSWLSVLRRGFFSANEEIPQIEELGKAIFSVQGGTAYSCTIGNELAGVASSIVHDRTALLAGDAVLPVHRAKGLQRLMIAQRLRDAAVTGVDLAMACALPGSASHRNYERMGFHVAYTKAILRLE